MSGTTGLLPVVTIIASGFCCLTYFAPRSGSRSTENRLHIGARIDVPAACFDPTIAQTMAGSRLRACAAPDLEEAREGGGCSPHLVFW